MGTMSPTPTRLSAGRQLGQTFALLLTFVLISALGGVLAAGLLAPLATGVNAMTNATKSTLEELPEELKPTDLPEQSIVYAADGTELARFYDQNRLVVPLSEVSEHLINAVIATEDRRFYTHGGVDPEGLVRAMLINSFTSKTQGASTLTQQYVKNMLINQALEADDQAGIESAREQTNERKLREIKLAIALEKQMTKDQILQGYLNIAQFGRSVYGVESAAQYYFSKPAKDLSIVEAATIAGITQAPNRWDPTVNPDLSVTRRNTVLANMLKEEYITQAEYEEAIATDLHETLNPKPLSIGCESARGAAFFCDYVTKIIMSDPVFGETREARAALLYKGGLEIHTTLDTKLQELATVEVDKTVPGDNESGIGAVIVTIKPGTGEVLAMAQNRKYTVDKTPAAGYTMVNYSTSQEYGGSKGFQAGSTFKPLVLAQWLKDGHFLNEHVNATRHEWDPRSWKASCLGNAPFQGSAPWNPRNVEGSASGYITAMQATVRSVNSGYATILNTLDMCDVAETVADLGFRPSALADNGEVNIVPSMVLGSQNVAPLDMANAYATIANRGVRCDPIAITRIVTRQNQELPIPQANCRQVIDQDVADGVSQALQQTLGVTKDKIPGGRDQGGKTGTTNSNTHTWFVGFTKQLSTAVWVGHPDKNMSMRNIRIDGKRYSRVYGSSISRPMWKRYMTAAHDGLPKESLGRATSTVLNGIRRTVPDVTGMTPADAIATLKAADFQVVTKHESMDSTISAGRVAATDPTAGSSVTIRSAITLYISTGIDPNPPVTTPPDPPDDPSATATSNRRGPGGAGDGRGNGDSDRDAGGRGGGNGR